MPRKASGNKNTDCLKVTKFVIERLMYRGSFIRLTKVFLALSEILENP